MPRIVEGQQTDGCGSKAGGEGGRGVMWLMSCVDLEPRERFGTGVLKAIRVLLAEGGEAT